MSPVERHMPALLSFIHSCVSSAPQEHALKRISPVSYTHLDVYKRQDDPKALKEFMDIKYQNKVRLAKYIKLHNGIDVDPNSIFDVQVKMCIRDRSSRG